MTLPTLDSVKNLLASGGEFRQRILSIARRLEALNEYNPEQALIVAADIVLRSTVSNEAPISSTQTLLGTNTQGAMT